MKRGTIVAAVMHGDFGKPRPAVVVQTDRIVFDSVIVCPLTSNLVDAAPVRVRVKPTASNGLQKLSDVMTDKVAAIHPSKCRQIIGSLEAEHLADLTGKLALILGLLD